ncbi:MAG: 2-amino-4-hydroxy-6-hydroxymethyldihydropteridine diphosphokinase [Dehalococcoidales bacterium]|nr:2-amino-4-hydroxy-6-hydroxymethyldihydropteridine diphosphokinase [Dehalococcoidales bacterium]
MNEVYLALGSNLGNKHHNLETARQKLNNKVQVTACSAPYDTAPVGNTQQPRFLNMVCRGKTSLQPLPLLRFLKDIEREMGRKPGPVNSPRPIDIDILFYNDQVFSNPVLVIPHPRLAERVFVLMPLEEIAPGLIHPVKGKTVREMLQTLPRSLDDIRKLEAKS